MGFQHNYVRITLHAIKDGVIRLDVRPDTANCMAGIEKMNFQVDWTNAGDSWLSVRVCDFTADGTKLITDGPDKVDFGFGSAQIGKIDFKDGVLKKKDCKYAIHFLRAEPPETIILDPTVILRPGDWVPETDP